MALYFTDAFLNGDPGDDAPNEEEFCRQIAIRLFARDLAFHKREVDRWVMSQLSDQYKKSINVRKKLAQLGNRLQKSMFGSDELRYLVFDHAWEYEQEHANESKMRYKTVEERKAIWATAFNDVVFWLIVDPLRHGIKIQEFRAIEGFKAMYRAMFVAAADAMYMITADDLPLKIYPELTTGKWAGVYAAVRAVPETFPDRPTFDLIPAQTYRYDSRSLKKRFEAAKSIAPWGSEWENTDLQIVSWSLSTRESRISYMVIKRA